jgi:predicted Zn-dependent protease
MRRQTSVANAADAYRVTVLNSPVHNAFAVPAVTSTSLATWSR